MDQKYQTDKVLSAVDVDIVSNFKLWYLIGALIN